jgi:hypothetical protein
MCEQFGYVRSYGVALDSDQWRILLTIPAFRFYKHKENFRLLTNMKFILELCSIASVLNGSKFLSVLQKEKQ